VIESKASGFFLKFIVVVSVFGLFGIPMLLSRSGGYQIDFLFTKQLIGSLYACICILGISAIFYPNKCEETFMFRKYSELRLPGDHAVLSDRMRFRGHHPDCEAFSANRITIQQVTLCSACTGLLVGALLALSGTVFYFFVGVVPSVADPRVFFVGYAGMALGLVQFKLGGYLKLVVNALFVLGSFVTLITADSVGKSLLIDLYVIGVIVFFLLARIQISEWNNKRVCVKCERCELRA
jgi:hypothetical protein